MFQNPVRARGHMWTVHLVACLQPHFPTTPRLGELKLKQLHHVIGWGVHTLTCTEPGTHR